MKTQTKIFKALSDKNRLAIVKMLEVKPMCVCEITTTLDLAPSTVSKHLSLLNEAGLIQDHKEGKWVNYSLVSEPSPFVKEMLMLLRGSLKDDPELIPYIEKARRADRVDICR
ncbi:MAG: metalloregulator ArsR/SmtB family transcription factor [Candidatus Aminicenantes bacterium]|jgi:DNA-binding transcriptional ArsR family regulator